MRAHLALFSDDLRCKHGGSEIGGARIARGHLVQMLVGRAEDGVDGFSAQVFDLTCKELAYVWHSLLDSVKQPPRDLQSGHHCTHKPFGNCLVQTLGLVTH